MVKKRKCRPQNYQCGGVCIKGAYICHVDGLQGQSVSIADKLVEVIKISKEKETFNFEGPPEPKRMIENGRIFVEQNMDIESLNRLVSAMDKKQEKIAEAEDEWFHGLEKLEADIIEIRVDIKAVERGLAAAKSIDDEISEKELNELLELMNKTLTNLVDEYKESSQKGVNVSEVLGKGDELENFANLKSKLIANTTSSLRARYNIKSDETWKAEAKEHLGEAYSILGFDREINIINDDSRPYATAGFTRRDSLAFDKTAEKVGSKKAREIASDIYNEDEAGSLNIGDRSQNFTNNKSAIFHELAHHVEFSNRDIAYANRQWMESRREGPDTGLNELTGSKFYSEEEIAVPDKFVTEYVGRVYENIESPLVSSEVFSVGFESFSSNEYMMNLYRRDKEHFYLTVGTILEYQNKRV